MYRLKIVTHVYIKVPDLVLFLYHSVTLYIYMHICMHVCMYLRIQECKHTHIHTHTFSRPAGRFANVFTFIDGITVVNNSGEEVACLFVSVRGFCTTYTGNWQNQLWYLIGGLGHLINTDNFIQKNLIDK